MTITMEARGATFADTGETREQRDAYHAAIVFAGNTAVGAVHADSNPVGKTYHHPEAVGVYQLPQTD